MINIEKYKRCPTCDSLALHNIWIATENNKGVIKCTRCLTEYEYSLENPDEWVPYFGLGYDCYFINQEKKDKTNE